LERFGDVEPAEWTNGDVTLRGVVIGAGKPVVMLHGFPEFFFTWREQFGPLAAKGYRVIAPDLRGYNRSDKPSGVDAYSISNVASDIVAILRGLGEPAVLVGHDWGGVTAWRVAREVPELIRRLVIINIPYPPALQRYVRVPRQLARFWYQFAMQPPLFPEMFLRVRRFAMLRRVLKRSVRR
jgi:pimeloyl-ACP methyl ester carboxylesterase